MSTASPCAYCGRNSSLKDSHLIPRWMIKRAQAKSPTGRLRDADNINKAVQDGEKFPMLCTRCEQKFGDLESAQAKNHDGGHAAPGAAYDADFCRFVVSLLWRVGVSRLDELLAKFPKCENSLRSAIRTWKEFLDGSRNDLGSHPVYFLFLDHDTATKVFPYREEELPNDGPAPVLHRYMLNSINTQLTVYEHDGYALVWAMGNAWLMVGVIEIPATVQGPTAIHVLPSGGIFPKVSVAAKKGASFAGSGGQAARDGIAVKWRPGAGFARNGWKCDGGVIKLN